MRSLSFSAALATAEPVLIVVEEPNVPPVSGKLVSPSLRLMRSAGMPRTSPAICGMMV